MSLGSHPAGRARLLWGALERPTVHPRDCPPKRLSGRHGCEIVKPHSAQGR